MPIYDYRCMACSHEFEEEHSMQDAPNPTRCPKCNRVARKIIKRSIPIKFVGGGFYHNTTHDHDMKGVK